MVQTKMKDLRVKNNLTQEDMAAALSISQNAYCLIEKGVTRLVDIERINIIAKTLNTSPFELGLLDGLAKTQNFYEKVENAYNHIENLYADNKDLVNTLKEELQIKNKQLEHLMQKLDVLINKAT
jgi:transcriptional regulator with XRE-family HTH domain